MSIESTISKIPENTSILQTTKFTFIIPDLPFARYFCQTVSLPGVSTTPVEVPTPFSPTFRHGDTLIFEPFSINAIVDEDLRVWEETYKWINSMVNTTDLLNYKKRNGAPSAIYYDGFLTINTNANNPNLRIKFKNVHPTSLGSVQFNTAENAETIPTADIAFRYDYFEIERI
jgi:hypothetical protein